MINKCCRFINWHQKHKLQLLALDWNTTRTIINIAVLLCQRGAFRPSYQSSDAFSTSGAPIIMPLADMLHMLTPVVLKFYKMILSTESFHVLLHFCRIKNQLVGGWSPPIISYLVLHCVLINPQFNANVHVDRIVKITLHGFFLYLIG